MKIIGWRTWSVAMTAIVLAFILAMFGKLTGDFALVAGAGTSLYSVNNMMQGRWGGGDSSAGAVREDF